MSSSDPHESRATTRVEASDTPRVDAVMAITADGYVLFAELARLARNLERDNRELLEAVKAACGVMEESDFATLTLVPNLRAAIARASGGSSDHSPVK